MISMNSIDEIKESHIYKLKDEFKSKGLLDKTLSPISTNKLSPISTNRLSLIYEKIYTGIINASNN